METREAARRLIDQRLDRLRELARQKVAGRQPPPQPPVVNVQAPEQPVINVQVVIPPEAIRVVVEQQPVVVNVPDREPPVVRVEPQINIQAARAPDVRVEPRIEVKVPDRERPSKATIKHADGSTSEVKLT